MTITATARRHVVRALKDALRINHRHAVEITERLTNAWVMDLVEGDMRTARFLVSVGDVFDRRDKATLYVDQGRGYDATLVSFALKETDIVRWTALPLEEAYAIAMEINDGASQDMIDADDRIAAEQTAIAIAENDDFLDLDALMGPVPESREWHWVEGKLLRADVATSGDHVVTLVELADGTRQTMAMLALFGTPADLLGYVQEQIGVQARLNVGRVNAFDRGTDIPAGFDRSMPLLDMVIPSSDAERIARSMRRAA